MRSLPDESGGVLLGQRHPEIRHVPPAVGTSGPEALDLLRSAGQEPDGWQCDAVCDLLAEGADGLWAARRTYLIVPRQNGKGGVIEPVELYGLFVLHETILHSAHLFDTARTAFERIRALIESTPDLVRKVKRINEAHGKEGIELLARPAKFAGDGTLLSRGGPGGQLRFHARTKGGGRGKSPQRIVLDEAFALTKDQMAALLPAISAQEDPQVNAFSTPPPVGEPCEVLMDARRQVLAERKTGRPAAICWLEWGVDRGTDVTKPETWARANPAYNIRISEKACRDELGALGLEEFGVERCGIWPLMDDAQWLVIPEQLWLAAADPVPRGEARPVFVVEMTPDREWTAILAGWKRPDGLRQLRVLDLRQGTGWFEARARELDKLGPAAWVVDRASPAVSLVPKLAEILRTSNELLVDSGREVVRMSSPDAVAAAGLLFDGFAGVYDDDTPSPRLWRHSGQKQLDDAIAAAAKYPPEDKAWQMDRARPGGYLACGAAGVAWALEVHGHVEEIVLEGSLMA